jgi:hypothetical protein
VAVAKGRETFTARLFWYPDQDRVAMEGTLSGAAVPFFIPALGEFRGGVQNMAMRLDATQEEDGTFAGALTIEAGRFEVRRSRVGGERWSDAPLEIRVRVEFSPETDVLQLRELEFIGQQIDVAAQGEVVLKGNYEGGAKLFVNRLPPAALTLGRNELLERLGIRVTAMDTSPTLRLEAAAKGPFRYPLRMEYDGSLRLSGWRLDAAQLPNEIDLENLNVRATNEAITLRDLALDFGGLSLEASGAIPISPGDEPPRGWLPCARRAFRGRRLICSRAWT